MPLDAFASAYAGFACLALATQRHGRTVALPALATQRRLRALGSLLFGLSLVLAVARFGPGQGVVAWIGLAAVAGLALVLLLSRSPRSALHAAVAMTGLSAAVALIG